MRILVNLLLGLMFGLGLVISGMANPAKVLNFLDLFGTWDPSLAFVMGSAVLVAFFGYRIVLRQPAPVIGKTFHLPNSRKMTPNIVIGPIIFGTGWGLGGFCPGPALTATSLAASGTLIFVPMMLIGMWSARMVQARGSLTPALARVKG